MNILSTNEMSLENFVENEKVLPYSQGEGTKKSGSRGRFLPALEMTGGIGDNKGERGGETPWRFSSSLPSVPTRETCHSERSGAQ